MSFEWPEFDDVKLDDERSFSARYRSDDQRKDEVEYMVTLTVRGVAHPPFAAHVWLNWPDDEWRTNEFTAQLLDGVRRVAATGKTNFVRSW